MRLFCIDIGNTHAHFGLWEKDTFTHHGQSPTAHLADPDSRLREALREANHPAALDGIAFCSVVPDADASVIHVATEEGLTVRQLTHETCPRLKINYPRPAEIGQDRLANALAALCQHGAPAIVIDMGTAVTFDIVGAEGSYEGGIIAPGLAVMTRYLHEQTALLPSLDPDDLLVSSGIGKSTIDAMKLGCAVGFSGMIKALLERVIHELDINGGTQPTVLCTGGTTGSLLKDWHETILYKPCLTLSGLVEAWKLWQPAPETS